jgi:regulator of protease activity HflC (stomatin/prohibitin superfamily)
MFDRLIDFIIQFARIFQFATVVEAYQRGVKLRLGKYVKDVGPGIHFYIPFWIEKILTEDVVTETRRIKPQSLTTKDDRSVVLSAVITFSISDVKVFLLEVEGRNNVVEDASTGAISEFIMKRTWGELVALNISNELSKIVRQQAKKYGVNIINVQLADFTVCPSLRLLQSQSYNND